MLQYNLTGEHFPLLLKKPFVEALLKSVQAPKTMFIVYIMRDICIPLLYFGFN